MFIADVQHPPRREVFASEEAALAWARGVTREGGYVVWELADEPCSCVVVEHPAGDAWAAQTASRGCEQHRYGQAFEESA